MKKNIGFLRVKKGAAILAAAMILGGCGGQGSQETTSAETVAEETTEAAEETKAAEESEEETAQAEESEETAGEEAEESQEEASEEAAETEAPSETAEEAEGEAAEGAATPKAIYDEIGKKVELPSMMEGDDSFISNYYGINPADLDGYVFASAEDATLADSVIIMNAKSEEAVDHIVSALNTVIEQKSAEMENYLPEQYEIVAKSSVKTEGTYVYLVISENADAIESVIQEALK